jgi:hypothetical protein
MMRCVRSLVHTWLVLDFFGDARRSGAATSTLTTTIFTQSFLALVFAALLYPDTPPVAFVAANLSLSSLLVAVGMLDPQDSTSRRLADRALVASSPMAPAAVLLARTAYAAFYVCLITIGMALPPAVLLACLLDDPVRAAAYVPLACACSGLAAGALGVALRALVRAIGYARAALVAGSIKAMLLGGGLVLFVSSMQRLQRSADDLPIGRLGAELLPPYQAARLLVGDAGDGWRVGWLLGAGLLLLLLALAIGDREPQRLAPVGRRAPLLRLLRILAPRGPRLGVADFVAVTMWRSAGFRSRVLPLLGLPAGMAMLSLPATTQEHSFTFLCLLLQLPAIYLPFLITFLPRADQADAGWVFAQAPAVSLPTVQDATWRALITHVLVPVHALALLLLALVQPSLDLLAASAFAFAIAVVASRAMVRGLSRMPFTREGEADTTSDLGSLFAFALVLGGVGTAFGALLPPALRWVAALGAAGAAAWLACRPASDRPAPAGTGTAPSTSARPLDEGPAPERPQPPAASLGRELRAILVLYAAVCVLPAMIGTMFAA